MMPRRFRRIASFSTKGMSQQQQQQGQEQVQQQQQQQKQVTSAHADQQKQQRQQQKQWVQDMLYRVRDVNYMPADIRASLLEFRVDGQLLGKVRPAMADLLCSIPSRDGRAVFMMATTTNDHDDHNDLDHLPSLQQQQLSSKPYVTLNPDVAGTACETRTAAVDQVLQYLRHHHPAVVSGWRNEPYPIASSFYDTPVFLMERAAVHVVGGLEYGIHINGLVVADPPSPLLLSSSPQPSPTESSSSSSSSSSLSRTTNTSQQAMPQQDGTSYTSWLPTRKSSLRMWIARRSKTKSKYPAFLDHIVAGGQPAGMGLIDNCIKECNEEAGISSQITMAGLYPVGAISYETYIPNTNTISRAVLFNFDLYLPSHFIPNPVDGEVDEFFLWTVDEIFQSMSINYPDPIKPNCYLVIIDFLVRHGYVSPECPGYLDLVRELRSGECQ